MLKMGVKKKHEHESGFFEENLLSEPTKSNRNLQNDWIHHNHYRNQSPRNIPGTQQTNGEPNYLSRPMELLDISRGINTNNKNYPNNFLSICDRENMSSTGESKGKHSSRNRTYRNQVESSSNAVQQQTIIISDEEDDDGDTRPYNAHKQTKEGEQIIFLNTIFIE